MFRLSLQTLLLGVLIGMMHPLSAQTLYNNSQTLFVAEDAVITVTGSIENAGQLFNRGTLAVAGDWSNAGTYADQEGTLIFLGIQPQRIDHQNQTVSRLVIEGGGEKILTSDLSVTQELLLSNGILFSDLSGMLTLTSTARITGGSDEAYVAGNMVYQGEGSRLFPLGINQRYRPLTFSAVTGTDPTLRVSIKTPNVPGPDNEDLARVATSVYWQVETISGTFDGSPVSLAVTEEDGFEDLIGTVVVQTGALGETYESLGQAGRSSDAVPGTVTSEAPATGPILSLGLTAYFALENQIQVPSAFAPDAPLTENRTVRVYAANLTATGFSFKIFDRWGIPVYQTASLEEAQQRGWNGIRTQDGQAAGPGVYQYYVRGVFEGSIPVEKKGAITLFR